MENKNEDKYYTYSWYKENYNTYSNLRRQSLDIKNKYFLFGIGGAIVLLCQLLDKFNEIIRIGLLIEMVLLINYGFMVLYSLLKEVEVSEQYIKNFEEAYEKYGEQKIDNDANRVDVMKIIFTNKYYDEAETNEKNMKIFFKIIIVYTVILCGFIVISEGDSYYKKNNKNLIIEIKEEIKEMKVELNELKLNLESKEQVKDNIEAGLEGERVSLPPKQKPKPPKQQA